MLSLPLFYSIYVGQVVSPFTGRGTEVQATRSPSTPELRPPLSGGQEAFPPWGLALVSLQPASCPSGLEGWGGRSIGQNFRDPVGAGPAVGCLQPGEGGVSQEWASAGPHRHPRGLLLSFMFLLNNSLLMSFVVFLLDLYTYFLLL